MSNYKIRVNSEAESKEAQELFFELGYEKGVCSTGDYPALIIATPESRFQKTPYSSRATSLNHEAHSQYKEITLAELRDLVVLKRNDRNDRTHTDQDNWSWFISSNGTGYVFGAGNANGLHQWDELSLDMVDLKPIEKKEMKAKEYLKKIGSNEYMLMDGAGYSGQDNWIEIPEGAEMLIQGGSRYFVKYEDGIYKQFYFESKHVENNKWVGTLKDLGLYRKDIVWQRETLNDQVASAKAARQSDKVLEEILNGVLPEFNIKNDNVNQPIHYCSHPSGIECIEITRHHDFSIGNAIKYLWRAGLKDSNDEIQDLEKAIWYIQDKINQLKNK